jgi:hypothetical protein
VQVEQLRFDLLESGARLLIHARSLKPSRGMEAAIAVSSKIPCLRSRTGSRFALMPPLPRPSVSPSPSFCADRPPTSPRALPLSAQIRNLARWRCGGRPGAAERGLADRLVASVAEREEVEK